MVCGLGRRIAARVAVRGLSYWDLCLSGLVQPMGYGYGTFWGAQAGNGHHEWEMKTPVGLPVCPETREQGR